MSGGARAPPVPTPTAGDPGVRPPPEVRARDWRVRGISKVAGVVEVGSADLRGTVVVGGTLTAASLEFDGTLEARSQVAVSGKLRGRGQLGAEAGVRAGEAELAGVVRVSGELVASGRLRVRGRLQAPSVRSEVLDLRGSAQVPGEITAPSCRLTLTEDTSIGTIRCRDLRLRGPPPNLVRRVLSEEAIVRVDAVEGETVSIEFARVRFVRAREVTLGRGAHVAAVEGKVVRTHRSSRLGPESWSRPPPGLSR